MRCSRSHLWILQGLLLLLSPFALAQSPGLPGFDFRKQTQAQQWLPTHDISGMEATPEGMVIHISGGDPYTIGPQRDYPADQPLWLKIRVKSEQGGSGQVFYFRDGHGPTEADSVRFPVRAGVWDEAKVPLPPLGNLFRLRFDPPGDHGDCTIASISLSPRNILSPPKWPVPFDAKPTAHPLHLTAGALELFCSSTRMGDFEIRVAGKPFARGLEHSLLGYITNGAVRWAPTRYEKMKVTHSSASGGSIGVRALIRDLDGATWTVTQRFNANRASGTIDVRSEIAANRSRDIIFAPMMTLFAGAGSSGPSKDHALFAGLEYLDKNEPSSSEADIIGPGSHRQTPDTLKVTIPLMVIQKDHKYVGIVWKQDQKLTPLFDSPDRQFHSNGHLMGLIFPGSDGANRIEGSLLPYEAVHVDAGKSIVSSVTVIGGVADGVIPAVQKYVALRGLPAVPSPGRSYQSYLEQSAHGWLDSKITENYHYRHAYVPGGSFQPVAAADAPMYMEWLAAAIEDQTLKDRLVATAARSLEMVSPAEWNSAGVSHVRSPAPALVFGHVEDNANRCKQVAEDLLGRFESDGSVLYHKSPDSLDYGKTHFEPDANGLTAQVVAVLLENAAYCGDAQLIHKGIERLRALDKFMNSAPRGAQTWEVPLHTPDILASAHLVRAYTLGYQLTGDSKLLDSARYWAWTGVPFTYLEAPTQNPIGLYATIPVLGATQWNAPDWMGLPVQWCGLVYSAALYYLADNDPSRSESVRWRRVADGITASGIQQSYTEADPDLFGLLPDSFNLRPQTRNYAAINPGTVFMNAIRMYRKPEIYSIKVFRKSGVIVHAPCSVSEAAELDGKVSFRIAGWQSGPYYLLLVGFKQEPQVTIDGVELSGGSGHEWHADTGRLILKMEPGQEHRASIKL